MRLRTTLKDASGFSLVELMVVVAIIGLLSAVAIPNFKKYQSRTKTTEAKLQLSAVYMSQASFYGSYQMYHSCLNYMGYDPREYRNSRYYTIGFRNDVTVNSVAYTSAINLDLNATECPETLPATADLTYFEPGIGVGNVIADMSHLPATAVGDQTIPQMTYTAGAAGVINAAFDAATNSSAFTIDQDKTIQSVRVGY